MSVSLVREWAYAKLNLVLHVGRPRPDGLHPLCSIFASIDLADEVHAGPAEADSVECPGVEGPNLAAVALAALRERLPLPPVGVRIAKRIPVAAGLGGGSADAAAVLRAANRIAGDPLDAGALREIAATLGSDVPSQVEPRHALVRGSGEIVEPIELPPLAAVLVPQPDGLATAAVYAELDRMHGWRDELDPDRLRALAARASAGHAAGAAEAGASSRPVAAELAAALENDLQPAALSLRPELGSVLDDLRAAGALGALVSGSGPTCFGLFANRAAADSAAAALPGALVAQLRTP
jgi:4-diphosphocytidyl-2-C-methyl-D-erythritol kinase